MKKITKKMTEAVFSGENFKESNTGVIRDEDVMKVYLFGNLIAKYDIVEEILWVSNCGWITQTTKERLNGLLGEFCGSYIFQRDYKWLVQTPLGIVDFENGMTFDCEGNSETFEERLGA